MDKVKLLFENSTYDRRTKTTLIGDTKIDCCMWLGNAFYLISCQLCDKQSSHKVWDRNNISVYKLCEDCWVSSLKLTEFYHDRVFDMYSWVVNCMRGKYNFVTNDLLRIKLMVVYNNIDLLSRNCWYYYAAIQSLNSDVASIIMNHIIDYL